MFFLLARVLEGSPKGLAFERMGTSSLKFCLFEYVVDFGLKWFLLSWKTYHLK